MSSKRSLLLLAAALLCPACVRASDPGKPSPRTNYYLTERQQLFPDFKAPPAVDSKEEAEDLAVLRRWNKSRTEEQCARARSQAYARYDEFFGGVSPFPRPLPDGADAILNRIGFEANSVASVIKDRFLRPRPHLRDADLKHCLDRIGGPAYPSGHTVISRVYALLLSDLVPARRAEFLALADEAALNRVISGVHYPSDVEAGKKLADQVYARFLKSRAFRKDIESLKGYLVNPRAQAPRAQALDNPGVVP